MFCASEKRAPPQRAEGGCSARRDVRKGGAHGTYQLGLSKSLRQAAQKHFIHVNSLNARTDGRGSSDGSHFTEKHTEA